MRQRTTITKCPISHVSSIYREVRIHRNIYVRVECNRERENLGHPLPPFPLLTVFLFLSLHNPHSMNSTCRKFEFDLFFSRMDRPRAFRVNIIGYHYTWVLRWFFRWMKMTFSLDHRRWYYVDQQNQEQVR